MLLCDRDWLRREDEEVAQESGAAAREAPRTSRGTDEVLTAEYIVCVCFEVGRMSCEERWVSVWCMSSPANIWIAGSERQQFTQKDGMGLASKRGN